MAKYKSRIEKKVINSNGHTYYIRHYLPDDKAREMWTVSRDRDTPF